MNLIPFTIFDTQTLRPKRYGEVEESLLDKFVIQKMKSGEDIIIGSKANLREDQVIAPINGAAPYLSRRPQADIDADRYREPQPTIEQVFLEILKAKGLDVTEADVLAATERVRTKLKGK